MKIYESITDLIGNTPLLELKKYSGGLSSKILAKLECFNPAGSVKDRVAKSIIEDAEKKGLIKEGSVIIEPTSGNTGIGLALVCATKGLKAILTMPDTMSEERIALLRAYGAEVILTDGKKGMTGAVEKANELLEKTENSFILGQFTNPENPKAHYNSTGPEIWRDTDGSVDIFVAGVGTGGTLSGTGKYLKEKNPDIKVVAVEPFSSPLLSEGKAGAHAIQGIGANFVPETLDMSIIDEIIKVKNEDAISQTKELARSEGFLAGISSGAALFAAREIANRPENKGKTIVVILPDSGERYLSCNIFE